MKYNKSTIKKITQALCDGQGRVRACKIAGIHYDTFMEWMRSKPEFAEAVKKAEATGNDKIKDICQRRIIEDKSWQSAAWWLERTDPANYGQRNNLNINAEKPLIVVADEETKNLLEKLDDNTSI
jgi:hypothetical protein